MPRTLYLHIGSHRTATTSTQQFMHRNFDRLLEEGVFYPFRVPRHLKFINELMSGEKSPREAAKTLNNRANDWSKKLKKEIHTIVLSDEDICVREDLKKLSALREFFDVKIIFSLRRQDLWLESWFFQNIKWQWNPKLSHCTFDEFLNQKASFHWIHYDAYLRNLERGFGKENIQLLLFEREQMANGAIAEFAAKIGLENIDHFGEPPHMNSSMSAEMVEFIRHLPLDKIAVPERNLLRMSLEQVDRRVLGNTKNQSERLMPPAQRKEILAEYAPGNHMVARRYFDRDDLFFAPLPNADAPLARMEIPQDSSALMEKFVAPLLKQLIANGTISAQNQKKQ